MKCDMWHITLMGWRTLALKVWKWWCHVTRKMWHVTSGIWHMTYNTQGRSNIVTKCQVPSSNSLKYCLSEGFLYIDILQPYVISISFHFHFVEIFNPHPDWVTFYLVFSFGQHLLCWEGLFPFALWTMPSFNPWQNGLIQNALFKKGILNKSIFSSGIRGHF